MNTDEFSKFDIKGTLERLGITEINSGATTGTKWLDTTGMLAESISPLDGKPIAEVRNVTLDEYKQVMDTARQAFPVWRNIPAPKRGEVVRQIGNALRDYKDDLGKLVTL